jgi:glyoxylate/hydroxypyruvate reductase A
MTLTILFAAGADAWKKYRAPLETALAQEGVDARLTNDIATPPDSVDHVIYAPSCPLQDFTPYRRTKLVQSLWAGVERIVTNPTLTQPLCRMVDPGLTQGMVEYVVGHTLRYHLGLDVHITRQDGAWRHHLVPPLARDRPVAMLGLGELGQACAGALQGLGFAVLGWSRQPKSLPGIECHSGEAGLEAVLGRAQIVVTLLPQTPETIRLIDARRLAMLPRGACLINPGRGPLIDDDALLAALDDGQLGHATLDVFREEPLPSTHPFWAHPHITVTPHIAAETRPVTASQVVAQNIRRAETGMPLLFRVDRTLGY